MVRGQRWRFVINLVTQDHPERIGLHLRGSYRPPMGDRCFLDPSQVNGIIDVVQLIDIGRIHSDRDLIAEMRAWN